jgi:hypothetical protein
MIDSQLNTCMYVCTPLLYTVALHCVVDLVYAGTLAWQPKVVSQ